MTAATHAPLPPAETTAAGNMGPKVESILRFLRGGGREAIVTCYEQLHAAVTSRAGTHILPDASAATVPEPSATKVTK